MRSKCGMFGGAACSHALHTPACPFALQLAAAQAPLLAGQVNFSGPAAQVGGHG